MSLGSSIFKWVQGLVGITDSNGDQIDSTDDLSTSVKRLNVNNGTEELLNSEVVSRTVIKNDLPIDINISQTGESLLEFNEITAVTSSTETLILSYTVPVLKDLNLKNIFVSGTNKATYNIYIDSVLKSKVRTYFSEYNASLLFNIDILTGGKVEIKAIHERPQVGNFNATIIGVLNE